MLQVGFVWRLLADIKHSYPYKRIHHGFLSKINNQRYYKRLEFKVYLNQISSLFVILISFFQPYHTDNFFPILVSRIKVPITNPIVLVKISPTSKKPSENKYCATSTAEITEINSKIFL